MELALYDADGGYYASTAPRLGRSGDFVTASDSGRAFGRAIATQLAEIDREIGPLDPFDVVEHGAGRALRAPSPPFSEAYTPRRVRTAQN